jgi:uncharacterized protein DUF4440
MKPLAVALFVGIVSASSLAQHSPDQDSIHGMRRASNIAIAAGDVMGFAVSLDQDFVVVTGNGSLLSREAYIAAFAKDFEDPHFVRFERIPDSIQVSRSVPLAAEHGHWVGRLPGGPVIFSGTRISQCGAKLRAAGNCGQSCSSRSNARTLSPAKAIADDMERRQQSLRMEAKTNPGAIAPWGRFRVLTTVHKT